jgi:hypothetical protein
MENSTENKPSKGGRPTSYKPEYVEQAEKLARLGATDKEMADFFNVGEKTLNNWKLEHPEFLQSLKEGKLLSDAKVTESLYNKAIGYEKNDRHYPADTTACIFWLKNRQPDKWREKADDKTDNASMVEILNKLVDKLPD